MTPEEEAEWLRRNGAKLSQLWPVSIVFDRADSGVDLRAVSPEGQVTLFQVKHSAKPSSPDRPAESKWPWQIWREMGRGGIAILMSVTAASGGVLWLFTALLGSSAWVSFLALVVVFLAAPPVLNVAWNLQEKPDLRARLRGDVARFSVRTLTGLAALLAGRDGPALLDESDDHLAGGSGHDLVSWAKVMEAAGFVIAGACYRGQDWADAAWRPVDAVLRSRFLSGLFVAVPTIVIAFEVLTHKGTMTLFTSFGSIFATGTFLVGAVKGGRKYRDIELPDPKARRAKE